MRTSTSSDRVDLTHSQRPIWIGQRLDAESPLYNMAFAFVLDGAIDDERFRQAWNRLVAASESLRTRIVGQGESATAQVQPTPDFGLEVADLSDRPDPLEAFRELARNRTTQVLPVDERLVEAVLARLGPQSWGFYLNQHHLITDAASTALLVRRLAECEREIGAWTADRARRWWDVHHPTG